MNLTRVTLGFLSHMCQSSSRTSTGWPAAGTYSGIQWSFALEKRTSVSYFRCHQGEKNGVFCLLPFGTRGTGTWTRIWNWWQLYESTGRQKSVIGESQYGIDSDPNSSPPPVHWFKSILAEQAWYYGKFKQRSCNVRITAAFLGSKHETPTYGN